MKKKAQSFSDKLINKWEQDIDHEFHLDRKFISNSFRQIITSTISPKYRAFQFRLIHLILVTNKSLYEWKIKEHNLCSFCNLEIETIYHLLWDCTITQKLWRDIFKWLQEKTQTNIIFNSKEILFGIENNIFSCFTMQFLLL